MDYSLKRLTWNSNKQMLNGSIRTGRVDKCSEDYQSVNIDITFLVAETHLTVLARLSHWSDSDFKRRSLLVADIFFLSQSCLRCLQGYVCSLEFTYLQDSL